MIMMSVCLKVKMVGMMGSYTIEICSSSNVKDVQVMIRRSRRRKMGTCRLIPKIQRYPPLTPKAKMLRHGTRVEQ